MTNNYDMKMPKTINNFILFNKVVINTSLLVIPWVSIYKSYFCDELYREFFLHVF